MIRPDAGSLAVVRSALTQAISETLSGVEQRVRVTTLAVAPDSPGAILRRGIPTDGFDQGAGVTFCIFDVPFELMLHVGPPGEEANQMLLDHWVANLLVPKPFDIVKGYDDWPEGIAAPFVESIGEEQLFDVGGVWLYGCLVNLQVQFHIEKREG